MHVPSVLTDVCCRFEMIDAARNRVRVKVCYVMMAMTIISCLGMVYLGKQVGCVPCILIAKCP